MIAWLLLLGSALAEDWRLVGAYDASAVAALGESEPEFVWVPDSDMVESCGPAKSPDGLGVFEAEAVANGLTPTLALVLERRVTPGEDPTRLTTRDVRLSIGLDGDSAPDDRILLQPMVEPRDLAVRIEAPAALARFGQLVRTQIEVETCLEHKVGRGWTGQDAERLRQAFLLTPPRTLLASRKYFGGERDPVPGLLGPPDACVVGASSGPRAQLGRGEGSLALVPTDVWGASLRPCDAVALTGGEVAGPDTVVPLSVTMQGHARRRARAWRTLEVVLSAAREVPEEQDVRVQVRHDDTCLFEGPLFRAVGASASLEDVLAKVPQRYPLLLDERVARTVLLVPNWQIVEALRQIASADAEVRGAVADLPPGELIDGVSFLLSHPGHLYVQIRPRSDALADACAPEVAAAEDAPATTWPNLSGVLQSRTLGEPWGYTVGLLDGRSAVVLPRRQAPSWAQTVAAQRGFEQAALLISLFTVFGIFLLALRRLPDLWARIPTERAWYWPGAAKAVPAEANLGEALPDQEDT